MFEHSVYTVARPEPCLDLWRGCLQSAGARGTENHAGRPASARGSSIWVLPEPSEANTESPVQAGQQPCVRALLEQLTRSQGVSVIGSC